MRRTLFVNGDSNVCGMDTAPNGGFQYEYDRALPGLLMGKYQFSSQVNLGLGGGSNARVLRTTLGWFSEQRDASALQGLFALIGWTTPDRREFYWRNPEDISYAANFATEDFYPFSIGLYDMGLFSRSLKKFWKLYIARGRHDETDTVLWLTEIVSLQSFFKSIGIPYLFFKAISAPVFVGRQVKALASMVDERRYFAFSDNNYSMINYLAGKGFKRGEGGHFFDDVLLCFSEVLQGYFEQDPLIMESPV